MHRMDLHNLTVADRHEIAVKYRGIAARTAARLAKKFHSVCIDDLISECWFGVLVGAMKFDAARSTKLVSHLFAWSRSYGGAFVKRELRRGLTSCSRGQIDRVGKRPKYNEADPEVRGWAGGSSCARVAAPRRPEGWTAEEWAALLAPLRPADRELVETVYRLGEAMVDLVGRFGHSEAAIRMRMLKARRALAGSESLRREAGL